MKFTFLDRTFDLEVVFQESEGEKKLVSRFPLNLIQFSHLFIGFALLDSNMAQKVAKFDLVSRLSGVQSVRLSVCPCIIVSVDFSRISIVFVRCMHVT